MDGRDRVLAVYETALRDIERTMTCRGLSAAERVRWTADIVRRALVELGWERDQETIQEIGQLLRTG